MDGWWDEIEREICACVARYGPLTSAELGRHLGMSEDTMVSVLRVLGPDSQVRMSSTVAPRSSTPDRKVA
jgi:hypothetical protein